MPFGSRPHPAKAVHFSRKSSLDFILLELDGVQPIDARTEEPDCPEELITMRSTAQRQPANLVFGAFNIWTESDIN